MSFTGISLLCSLLLLVRSQKTTTANEEQSNSGDTKRSHWPQAWTERGCRICNCQYNERTVNCSNMNFSKGLPPASEFPVQDVVVFLFSNANVAFIESDYFLPFLNLQDIYGTHNRLSSPFLLPPNISTLWLANNYISSMSGFFQRERYDYKSLESVDMGSNCIETLRPGDLSGFPGLRLLVLENMCGSLFLEIGAIANLSSLSELNLKYNKMTGISLSRLKNLGSKSTGLEISASNNDLGELNDDFLLLPAVTRLRLSCGKIERLHPNAFRGLQNLYFLDLSGNSINSLPSGVFSYPQQLHMLDLSQNNLTSVSGSAFKKGQQVLELYLDTNRLERVEESLFETITTLVILDLSTNKLSRLPSSLSNLWFLGILVLFGNNLTVIHSNTFSRLFNLQQLYLMRSQIQEIETGAFNDLKVLQTIYLEDNNLTSLPSPLFLSMDRCTIWLNCGQLETFPQVHKNLKTLCVTNSQGVTVSGLNARTVLNLANSGFVCNEVPVGLMSRSGYDCTECPAGKNATIPGGHSFDAAFCKDCPAGGWYQDEAGQKSCKKCVNGTFVPPSKHPGTSPGDCIVCPTGTNTDIHAGYRACPCLDGFYRLQRFGKCMACNATSDGLQCKNEYPIVKPGYWWSWSYSNASDMERRFVNFTEELQIRDDSYANISVTFTGNLPSTYICPLPDSCLGGIRDEELCKEGYEGPLCSVCDTQHFSWFNTCQPCPPLWRGVLQLLLIAFFFVLLMFGLFKADRLRTTRRHHAATVVDQIASKLKILIGFAQVMAGVLSALAYVPWPTSLLYVGRWLKIAELNAVDMSNPSCFSPRLRMNALEKTVVSIIGQTICLLCILLYYLLRYCVVSFCWKRFHPDARDLSLAKRSCLRNSWWILFLCYPSTAAHIMATVPYKDWTCMELCHYDQQRDCPWYLKADLSIECRYDDIGGNKVLFIVCWAMTVYVVCLPLLLFLGLLKRHRSSTPVRHHCSDNDDCLLLRRRGNRVKGDLLNSLEFLDENYRLNFWYWELLEIIRKFLLTCGVKFFGSNSLSGVAIAALIANAFLLLHAQFKPIKRKSEHWLQLLSLLVISLSLMLGTLVALQEATYNDVTSENGYDRKVFSVIILLVNGCFALYLIGRVCFSAYISIRKARSSDDKHRFVAFLIYFFSDDDSSNSDPDNNINSFEDESELPMLVDDCIATEI